MPRNPDDYAVGYRKPPVHSRFRKGQSGNPKGSKKGRKSLDKHIQDELARRITITENGERKTITKGEAVAKQLINKGVGGDAKAIPLIMSQDRQHQADAAAASADASAATWTSQEDQKVIQGLLARLRDEGALEGDGE